MLDLFCGAGGAARGYYNAGITDIVGVDLSPQKNYPYEFVEAEALGYVRDHAAEFDVIHASPPCQGYSIMHNLPWLQGRVYPRLIKPLRELLRETGKAWVIENVMGASYMKNLEKIGERLGEDITDHRMEANYLCGAMFGKAFFRHRLFETSFDWMMPGHPRHHVGPVRRGKFNERNVLMGNGGQGDPIITLPIGHTAIKPDPSRQKNPVNTTWRTFHDGQGNHRQGEAKISLDASLNMREGYEKVAFSYPTLLKDYNHSYKGWKLAGLLMEIDWMTRDELTQAIPPCYTEYIGKCLLSAKCC